MAQQQNGYDCGVFVLDATRALVTRTPARAAAPRQHRRKSTGLAGSTRRFSRVGLTKPTGILSGAKRLRLRARGRS